MTNENQRAKGSRISQETIAIVTVGVALVGLNLDTNGIAWQAESRQLRDEARSDHEALQREILRLTQGQAEIRATVASTQATNE